MKKQMKITYELLRADADIAADLLDDKIAEMFVEGGMTEAARARLKTLAMMLRGATHIVIYDSTTLPED